jgi:RIO kinase 2
VSSTDRAARVVKLLKDEEWKTLLALEKASSVHGFADPGMLSRLSRQPPERVKFALEKLAARGVVSGSGPKYALTRESVEALAIREYVRRDQISALGAIIAKGKESDVYEAFDELGSVYALKFFKLGRTSFTRVRRKRFIDRAEIRSWMSMNYEAAEREHRSLRKLEGLSRAFPKAISHNRSTVLLEELSGVKLSERPELVAPQEALDEILEAVRRAYQSAKLVNGDLSEYNILSDGLRVWLIDWPQAVGTDHPNAVDLLRHDVFTVVKFFKRAYGLEVDESSALDYAEGTRNTSA